MKTRYFFKVLGITFLSLFLLNSLVMAQIHYDNSGNVGIGTTSPHSKLHVMIPPEDNNTILLDLEKGNDSFVMLKNNGDFIVGNGNVGIGTNSPSALLDVNGKIISDDLSTKSLKTIIDTHSYSIHRKIRLNWSGGSTNNGYVGTYLITMGGRGDHHQTAFATGILIINKAYKRAPEIRFRVLSGYGVYMEEEMVTDTQLVLDFHLNLAEHTKSNYSVLKVSGSVGLSMDDSWSVQVEDDSDYTNGVGATVSEGVFMNGNVGIGTTSPSRELDVAGNVIANAYEYHSDSQLKKNIASIDNALDKVLALRGVEFEWRIEEYPEKGFAEGRKIGLIAQDVEQVIPEVVSIDDEGYKSVEYGNIVSVLIEAIKAQQAQIEELKARIELLEQ